MRLPGFNAEFGLSGWNRYFRSDALYSNRSSDHAVTLAAQCCPPGFDTTGCTPQDCTTLGCPTGQFCCDLGSSPRCFPDNLGGHGNCCRSSGGTWHCFPPTFTHCFCTGLP